MFLHFSCELIRWVLSVQEIQELRRIVDGFEEDERTINILSVNFWLKFSGTISQSNSVRQKKENISLR